MAVSGTISQTNFDVIRVIDGAYRRCKIPAQRITPEMQQIAIDCLYLLLSSAPSHGVQLWTLDEVILPLIASVAAQPTSAGTIDVLGVNLRSGNNDSPLTRISQDVYDALPNKLSSGSPVQFWVDRRRDLPVLMMWPVPSAAVAASTTMVIRRKRHIMDITSLTQTLDVPQRWHEAIIAGLAAKVAAECPEVDGNLVMKLEANAEAAWIRAQREERDSSVMTFMPRISGYTR